MLFPLFLQDYLNQCFPVTIPLGKRGLSIFTRAGHYFVDEGKNHTDKQNEKTMTIVHIEGKTGLDNLEEIMEVAFIDVFF